MRRTSERIPGQREAILAAIRRDGPPKNGGHEELCEWIRRQADNGKSETEIAGAIGWDLSSVRQAIAERGRA